MLTGKSQLQKIKYVLCVLSHLVVSDSATPWTVALPGSSVHRILQQEHWSGLPRPPPGDLSIPGTEPRSPTLQADSSPSEPPGKPTNTGVGILSLLQGIFPTQELNQGLLHCRQILYQLNYQGSPEQIYQVFKIVRLLEMKVQ